MFYDPESIRPFIYKNEEVDYVNHFRPYVKSIVLFTNPLYAEVNSNEKLKFIHQWLFPSLEMTEITPDFISAFFKYVNGNQEDKHQEPVFDFKYDEREIYGSFYSAYNIDLSLPNEDLTIQKFLALFASLPSNTAFCKLIEARTKEVPKPDKYNTEYRNSIVKMKESVRLYKRYKLSLKSTVNPLYKFITSFKK